MHGTVVYAARHSHLICARKYCPNKESDHQVRNWGRGFRGWLEVVRCGDGRSLAHSDIAGSAKKLACNTHESLHGIARYTRKMETPQASDATAWVVESLHALQSLESRKLY